MDDFKITMVFFEFVWVLVVISARKASSNFLHLLRIKYKRRTAESVTVFAINNGRELIMTIFEQISFLVQRHVYVQIFFTILPTRNSCP
jgi:predicted phosphoadenosine phosphosulfate sulfurtransferase